MKPWSFSTFASCCVVTLIAFLTQEHPPKAETAPASPALIRTGRLLDAQSGAYQSDQGVMIEGGYIYEMAFLSSGILFSVERPLSSREQSPF
jgi:hypothetical protein